MKTLQKLSVLLVVFVFNCSNVSEADLIDATPITTSITYTENIKAIIDNNCIVCHNNPPENGAPMALTTYLDVKNAVENGDLIERISSNDQGYLMPFGGPRLPQNLIDLVIQWQSEGLIE